MENSSNCDEESVAMIPNEKTLNIDMPSSSDIDVSSMVSEKEGCESPLSSWDSEPENDISSITSCHTMPEESLLDGVDNMDDGFSWEMDNRSYDELLKKLAEKEEELRVSNSKLQLSEQEIIKLAVQVDDVCEKLELKEDELYEQKKVLGEEISKLKIQNLKSENQLDDVRKELELNKQKEVLKNQIKETENQIDNVRGELNLKKEELQKQTAKLDTHIPKSVNEITNLTEQLEAAHKKLKISSDEIATLRKELGSKSSMTHQLQCQIKEEKKNRAMLENLVMMNEENNINHEEELRKLNSTLFDLQIKFFYEKKKMEADIASLSNQKKQLTSKLEDCESRNKDLEQKLRRNEAEISKFYQHEMRYLRKKVDERMNDVDAANKKSKKVMIEIDEANVKIDMLKAEICSRDDEISDMKKYMDEINTSREELVVDYISKLDEENKLKLRVEELEKEVSKQNGVILDMAEEKKEAIRELCNSLEHYRNGYNEVIQAFNGLYASRRSHCYSFLNI